MTPKQGLATLTRVLDTLEITCCGVIVEKEAARISRMNTTNDACRDTHVSDIPDTCWTHPTRAGHTHGSDRHTHGCGQHTQARFGIFTRVLDTLEITWCVVIVEKEAVRISRMNTTNDACHNVQGYFAHKKPPTPLGLP